MKKLLLLLFAGLAAVICQAQITNGVKISGLPIATTPLSGTEILVMNQSGTTKSATLNQVLASAVSQNTATSNTFQLFCVGNSNLTFTVSNTLAAQITGNSNSLIAISNYFQKVTGTNSVAISNNWNSLSNFVLSQNLNYYPTSNPSGFQNAEQVTSAATAAVATYASTGVTNGGSATLTNLVYGVANLPTLTNTTENLVINMARASIQNVTYSNPVVTSENIIMSLTNIVAGQNVSVRVYCLLAGFSRLNITLPTGTQNYNSAAGFNLSQGKSALISFTAFGTNNSDVIMTAAAQP